MHTETTDTGDIEREGVALLTVVQIGCQQMTVAKVTFGPDDPLNIARTGLELGACEARKCGEANAVTCVRSKLQFGYLSAVRGMFVSKRAYLS